MWVGGSRWLNEGRPDSLIRGRWMAHLSIYLVVTQAGAKAEPLLTLEISVFIPKKTEQGYGDNCRGGVEIKERVNKGWRWQC